ncbi:50S ribosomal protein L31 [soil metagenome]|jgi:large subunit ribosomal protein L31|nr:50S ribosomal protein L31 [Deinococcota bacterium]
MKADIHPKIMPAKIMCGCGNVIETMSTKQEIHIDVCSACHPFYTGQQRFIDTEGRVEKFQKRFANASYRRK